MIKKIKNISEKIKKKTSDKDFMIKLKNIVVLGTYVLFFVALLSETCLAANETILDSFNNMLNDVKKSLLKYSAAAAAIGIATGAFMKKFSFGRQEQIEKGGKLMRNSVIAFVIVHAAPRILNFVTSYLGHGNEDINLG
ncbi:MAG: hypothetical protein J6Y29_05185 [Clostridiales bacterium]|nr:hypothetical protein [Clostridiales bacterium]